MRTNKLGLKIVRINTGYTDVLGINEEQIWAKYVRDVRKELENIDNLSDSSTILMLTGIPTGNLITIASFIGGRRGDAITAWIYIPKHILISAKEVVDIIDVVRKEILADERNDDKLRLLFSKERTTLSVDNIVFISNGDKWGYRYYGQGVRYSLSDILGGEGDIAQSYYGDYKSIFLLEKSSGLRCAFGEDLTTYKLESTTIVNSPGRSPEGFIPYINDEIADKPLRFVIGDKIKVAWKRGGYRSILTETIIKDKGETSWMRPSNSDVIREFFPNEIINVVDERGKRVDSYHLVINGQQYLKGAPLYLRDNETKVRLDISAEGFDSLHRELDLDRPCPITLKRKSYSYTFVLPYRTEQIHRGETSIKLTLNEKLEECPFEGYTTNRGFISSTSENNLIYKPKKKRSFIIYFTVSLFVSLLIGFCGGVYVSHRVMENEKEIVENEKKRLEEVKKKEQEKAEQERKRKAEERKSAIQKYLDKNKEWSRLEMEEYSEISGLWDALNERNFEIILGFKDYLKSSTRFKEVVETVEKNKDKKFKGKYVNDNDIPIEGYIKALNDTPSFNSAKTESSKKKDKNKESEKGNDGWF